MFLMPIREQGQASVFSEGPRPGAVGLGLPHDPDRRPLPSGEIVRASVLLHGKPVQQNTPVRKFQFRVIAGRPSMFLLVCRYGKPYPLEICTHRRDFLGHSRMSHAISVRDAAKENKRTENREAADATRIEAFCPGLFRFCHGRAAFPRRLLGSPGQPAMLGTRGMSVKEAPKQSGG